MTLLTILLAANRSAQARKQPAQQPAGVLCSSSPSPGRLTAIPLRDVQEVLPMARLTRAHDLPAVLAGTLHA